MFLSILEFCLIFFINFHCLKNRSSDILSKIPLWWQNDHLNVNCSFKIYTHHHFSSYFEVGSRRHTSSSAHITIAAEIRHLPAKLWSHRHHLSRGDSRVWAERFCVERNAEWHGSQDLITQKSTGWRMQTLSPGATLTCLPHGV